MNNSYEENIKDFINSTLDDINATAIKAIESNRVSDIKILFNHIRLKLTIYQATRKLTLTNEEIIDSIEKCAKNNNVKLKNIPVDCFNESKANKALKKFDGQDLEKLDENIKLLNTIEEYITNNGHLKSQKK